MKAVHKICGQVMPDVNIQAEMSKQDFILGNISFPQAPIIIIDAPKFCTVCNRRLYRDDIVLMIGGDT